MTEELNHIVKMLSEDSPLLITGSQNGRVKVLEQAELIRIYANAGKVFAVIE